MNKSRAALDKILVDKYYDKISTLLIGDGEQVLEVPLTPESISDGYKLAMPVVDDEGNEKTMIIRVMVARNHRDGAEFDPYEQNQTYLENCEENRLKREARKNKK